MWSHVGLITLLMSISSASPTKNCWTDLAPLQVGVRQEHGVAFTPAGNGTIYAIGGLLGMNISPSVEAYSITNNSWKDVAPLPTAMHHPNVASYNGKIYVLGGVTGLFPWAGSADCFVYDPTKDAWEKLSPLPNPRGSAVVGLHNGTIWLAGGMDGIMKAVDPVDSYDIAANKWTSHPELKLAETRDHAGGGVVGSTLYIVGGRNGLIEARKDETLALDLMNSTKWVTKAKMPTGRGGSAVTVVGKKIYVFGGEGNPDVITGVYGSIDVYDTEKDSWSSEGAMKYPVHGTGAVNVGEKIYIPAGSLQISMGEPSTIMEAYGPGTC